MAFDGSSKFFSTPDTVEVAPDTKEGIAEIGDSAEDLYTNEIAQIVEQAERDFSAGISYFPPEYFDGNNGEVHAAVTDFSNKFETVNAVLAEIEAKIEQGEAPVTEDDVDKIEQAYVALQQARDQVREQFSVNSESVEEVTDSGADVWDDVRNELDQVRTEVAAESDSQTTEGKSELLDVEADMALNESKVPTIFEREFTKVSTIESDADALTERLLSLHIDGSSQPAEVAIYINRLHEISTYASELAIQHSGFNDEVSDADKRSVATFVGKAQSQLIDIEAACQLLENSTGPLFSESSKLESDSPLQLTAEMMVGHKPNLQEGFESLSVEEIISTGIKTVAAIEIKQGWNDTLVMTARTMLEQLQTLAATEPQDSDPGYSKWLESFDQMSANLTRLHADHQHDKPPSLAEDPTSFATVNLHKEAGGKRLRELDVSNNQLEVFGMSIPTTGPDGVFGARSFRESLNIQQHSYPENSAERQVVQQMMSVIAVVPDSGVTQEQQTQLAALAKQLQSPGMKPSARPLKRKTLEPADLSHPEASVTISAPNIDMSADSESDKDSESAPEAVSIVDNTAPVAQTEADAMKAAWDDVERTEKQAKHATETKKTTVKPKPKVSKSSEPKASEVEVSAPASTALSSSDSWFGRKNESFESILQREIDAIESPAVSRLDVMFGDTRSAYEVLGEVPFSDIQDWSELSHYALKAELDQPNISLTYEMFDQWLQRMPEIQDIVPESTDLTFKEVVDLYMERTLRNYS